MAFNYKEATIKEDGTLVDNAGNTIPVGSKGYALFKARVEAKGVFARKKKSVEEHKQDLEKKSPLSYKWFKALTGSMGIGIDRSGYKAVIESIKSGKFSMEKVLETLKKYKKKNISATIVYVADGKETDFTRKILEKEARKEARLREQEERRLKKQAEIKAKAEEQLVKARAKLEMLKRKEEERIRQIEKKLR